MPDGDALDADNRQASVEVQAGVESVANLAAPLPDALAGGEQILERHGDGDRHRPGAVGGDSRIGADAGILDNVHAAQGEAQQTIQEAEGYALDRVNRASGDSARFVALFEAYRKAPDVTRKRIYLETMNEVLPKVNRKVIVDEDIKGFLPLLNLGDGSVGTPAKGGP